MSTFMVMLSVTDTLCFKLQNGNLLKLTNNIDIYYPSYNTFDYDLSYEKSSRCKGGVGSFCWNNNGGGNCRQHTNPLRFKSKGLIEGFDCQSLIIRL